MTDFTRMTTEQIEEELMKLCIAERFDGDVAWLTRAYDGEHSLEKAKELDDWLHLANPRRHSSLK
ncbi:hypothetical protein [Propionivibrio dicarboxylicus]|uniref:Uncharacterized protein n=1 Tax=Propionivibrio dicarboxylicus TaxID=83767 RepID=A0A1G7WM06_9RHOO|nr:hypothetical protein [Propionivibrio dicarboxylicus]SDG72260.1 hypothetical protein SAMN05660652_00545 [Propionivibrio dicarboxylicus]